MNKEPGARRELLNQDKEESEEQIYKEGPDEDLYYEDIDLNPEEIHVEDKRSWSYQDKEEYNKKSFSIPYILADKNNQSIHSINISEGLIKRT